MDEPLFGVDELVARAEARVAAAGISAASGQVAEALTVRNARYYATLGLLAPAAARRGRNALYTDAHVDQLVAVKRLQAEGLHLAEIQRALVGLDPDRVRAVAEGEAEVALTGMSPAQAPAIGTPSAAAHDAGAREATSPGDASPRVTSPSGGSSAPPVPTPAALVIDLGEGVGLQVPPGLVLAPPAVDRVLDRARAVLSGTAGHSTPSLIFPNLTASYGPERRG